MGECADGILDTLLQVENLGNAIKTYPIPPIDVLNPERIQIIEEQQEAVADLLNKLTLNNNLTCISKVLEDILSIEGTSDDLPHCLYPMLMKKPYLNILYREISTTNVELAICVLTKILEYCQDKDDFRQFSRTFFYELDFEFDLQTLLLNELEKCLTGEENAETSIVVILLNFLVQFFKRLSHFDLTDQNPVNNMLNFTKVIIKSIEICMFEEDVALYGIELLECLLLQHRDGVWLMLIKNGWYRVLFGVLSTHPYESKHN
uniref:Uncharacterized protein n=1 Tax=Clytia hemisphaerica TaxID=252671 RepID=A0A7M5X8X2_9CNID